MASASGLTTRTVAGRAGAEHQRADFAAADAAGLAAAAVDKPFLLEVPGCAIGTEEIAQGGAAALDRFGQNFKNPVGEPRAVGMIGRASCRDRVCPSVLIQVVAGSSKKKIITE